MTTPPAEQQLTPDREQKIRRNYASFDADGTVNVLLAEIRRLRTELAESESDVALLRALEAAGVDNWEGYDEAIQSVEP